jgi:hypothetical protein
MGEDPAGAPAAPPPQAVGQDLVARVLGHLEQALPSVLGRSISRDENFFEAGLTSADLVRLHAGIGADAVTDLPVTALFAYPNLRALGRYLSDGEAPPRAADRGRRAGLRVIGAARRELRQRTRNESERP